MGLGARVTYGLLAVVAAAVALVYLSRILLADPVYAGAESAHMIRALYGKVLAAHPLVLPQLRELDDTVFSLIVRGLSYATSDLLPWLRTLGAAAYLAGLALVFLSMGKTERARAVPILLAAFAYPYYRFAAAALPEGWYVGVLGLTIFATARLYMPHPILHAALAGALSAVLVLLAPQGVAVCAAFAILAMFDLALGRRDIRLFLGRLVIFVAALAVGINLLQMIAGQPVAPPLSTYLGARYETLLADGQASWLIGVRTLVAMIFAAIMLAGAPILTGMLRVEMRWRWLRERGRFVLAPQEAAFLLTVLTLAGTLIATAILATAPQSDPSRIWGRQFEALLPMLWLAAAPFIGEFERGAGRWWRVAMGVAPVVGLAGLTACLLDGVTPNPWDAAALGAFAPTEPYVFAAAGATMLAAGAACTFTAWPLSRIWLAAFIALAVMSTALDLPWQRDAAAGRARLLSELSSADKIIARRPGGVAVVASDPVEARLAYWRLRARPDAVMATPDPIALSGVETVVLMNGNGPGPGWSPILKGRELTVFGRQKQPRIGPRASVTGGGGLGSGPGSS
jgi:hypothetical protein